MTATIGLLAIGTFVAMTQGVDAAHLTAKNGTAQTVDASKYLRFAVRWREPVVRTGVYRRVQESFGQPAVSERHGLIVVGSGEGEVRALNLADGTVAWTFEHGIPFETGATVAQLPDDSNGGFAPRGVADSTEVVLLASRDGTMLALDVTSGAVIWRAAVGGDVRAAPVVRSDRIYAATASNSVVALDLNSGKTIWSQGRSAPTDLTIEGHARPFVDEEAGRLYACFSDGYATAMNLDDGARIWDRPLSVNAEDFFDADADPVVKNGRLFVASYSDGVYALNPESGDAIWFRSAPAVASLAATEHLVLAASADGYVWGLSQDRGEMSFRTRIPAGPVSRLQVRQGLVVMTSGDSGLLVLDSRTGEPLQATAFGGRVGSDPAWVGRDLAVLSGYGYLYVLRMGAPGLLRQRRQSLQ